MGVVAQQHRESTRFPTPALRCKRLKQAKSLFPAYSPSLRCYFLFQLTLSYLWLLEATEHAWSFLKVFLFPFLLWQPFGFNFVCACFYFCILQKSPSYSRVSVVFEWAHLAPTLSTLNHLRSPVKEVYRRSFRLQNPSSDAVCSQRQLEEKPHVV